jgi:hypothetical protein
MFMGYLGKGMRHFLELLGLASVVASVVIVYATYKTTLRQEDTARQTLLASRYAAATENFTTNDLSKRVSGIHELGQLAVTEPRYRASVMDMMESFIRQTAPRPGDQPCKDELAWDKGYKAPDHGHLASAQALALSVIVDLSKRVGPEEHRVNLNNACLIRVNLMGANLRGADFGGADLQGARLAHATLDGASMEWAVLQYADFEGASLRGVNAGHAVMHCVTGANVTLDGAELDGVQQSESAQWPADRVKAALHVPQQFGAKAQLADICKL